MFSWNGANGLESSTTTIQSCFEKVSQVAVPAGRQCLIIELITEWGAVGGAKFAIYRFLAVNDERRKLGGLQSASNSILAAHSNSHLQYKLLEYTWRLQQLLKDESREE